MAVTWRVFGPAENLLIVKLPRYAVFKVTVKLPRYEVFKVTVKLLYMEVILVRQDSRLKEDPP